MESLYKNELAQQKANDQAEKANIYSQAVSQINEEKSTARTEAIAMK